MINRVVLILRFIIVALGHIEKPRILRNAKLWLKQAERVLSFVCVKGPLLVLVPAQDE